MKTIKEVINEVSERSKKILAENPDLTSMSFVYEGFPVDEVRQAAQEYQSEVELSSFYRRYHFCLSLTGGAFIHIRSVKVKVREVIEVEEETETA